MSNETTSDSIDARSDEERETTQHECGEAAADAILLGPGDRCPFCEFVATGHSPPNLDDDHVVDDYIDADEVVTVSGHATRGVSVLNVVDGGLQIRFECLNCGVVSNSITRFAQDECSSDPEIVTDGGQDWHDCDACGASYRSRSASLRCCGDRFGGDGA